MKETLLGASNIINWWLTRDTSGSGHFSHWKTFFWSETFDNKVASVRPIFVTLLFPKRSMNGSRGVASYTSKCSVHIESRPCVYHEYPATIHLWLLCNIFMGILDVSFHQNVFCCCLRKTFSRLHLQPSMKMIVAILATISQ